METKSHHKTESALNECLLFETEINKSTSINVITENERTERKKKKG
jgi:NAD kinase